MASVRCVTKRLNRHITYISLDFFVILDSCNYYGGDGYCDDNNNVPECNYDGGDCCGSCINKQYCSTCACFTGGSGNGIADSWIGNGFCDVGINNAECQFDGGDCSSM